MTIRLKIILLTLSALTPLLSYSQAAAAQKPSLNNPYSVLVALAFNQKIEGGPTNYAEAVTYYCREARTGNANAQYAMGWLYSEGRGVEKNNYIAHTMLSKAAAQGHGLAKELLPKVEWPAKKSKMPACLKKSDISANTTAMFKSQRQIYKLVQKLALPYEIDANLVMTIIAVESGFNPKATSPKNAQGLMQLIPDTAKRFRVKDAYNAEDNIKGGLAYLQWLLSYFQGDIVLVAAAYNAGERAVEKYKGIPPYPETQNYVKKITKLYKSRSHPYRKDLVKPSLIVAGGSDAGNVALSLSASVQSD